MRLAIVEVERNSKIATGRPLKNLPKRGLLLQLFSYCYFGFYFLKQNPLQKQQVIHHRLLFLKNQI
jgi:hypothetical protein